MRRAALLLTGAIVSFLFVLTAEAVAAERGKALPRSFVYLKDIDPTIVQDIRYATPFNFTGAPVPGYDAPECVLLREVAEALKAVQDELRAQNLGLKVYDCYRPRRAVSAFVGWVEKPGSKGDERHYPHTSRADLVKLGYISAVSSHSYGTAVDLTLIALPREPSQAEPGKSYGSCVAPRAEREPDESLDMGTGFDCFDLNSRNPALLDSTEAEAKEEAAGDGSTPAAQNPGPAAPEAQKSAEKLDSAALPLEIEKDQRDRRLQLFELMKSHGFKGIRAEWWHYQYTRVVRPLKPQDFVIPSAKPR
jgi:D-alanyl-D-alanine dipeptidase